MSKEFKTRRKTLQKSETFDDRQKRIPGWDRDAIRNATVLVIGAGAIANETIKNLALLGFGHIIVADFDTIEFTNLTRTVLFSQNDINKKKAEVAVQKYLEMNLEPTATADTFDGDVVYELGDGVIRRADIVLGCLDNLETRFAVNHACMRYNIPYIDAAIDALSWTLKVCNGHDYGCFECFGGNALSESRFRQSCANTMRKADENNKAATVQTSSAFVSAFQVQEALRTICNLNPTYGKEYWFWKNTLNVFDMKIDSKYCPSHASPFPPRETINQTPLSYRNTLREFLSYISDTEYDTFVTDEDKERAYVLKSPCPGCGKMVDVNLCYYKYFSDDFFCDDCKKNNRVFRDKVVESDLELLYEFSLETTPDYLLDKPLSEFGIPAFHVVAAKNSKTEKRAYFELTKDFTEVLPEYYRKHEK